MTATNNKESKILKKPPKNLKTKKNKKIAIITIIIPVGVDILKFDKKPNIKNIKKESYIKLSTSSRSIASSKKQFE